MKTLTILAALFSLATVGIAHAEDIDIVQPGKDYVAGCQLNFERIGQSLPCNDGSQITLELGTDHKAHVIKHTSAGMPGVHTSVPAESVAAYNPPASRPYEQSASRGCPAPAESIGPGEEWKCGVKGDDGLTFAVVVRAGTNTPVRCTIHYYLYTGNGWEPHGTGRFAMCQDQSSSFGVEPQQTRYAPTSALTRPPTQEAAVSVQYDGAGRVTQVHQEVRDPIAPKVLGGIALMLASGVSERIAYGSHGYYGYGDAYRIEGPIIPGGSCGGCVRH